MVHHHLLLGLLEVIPLLDPEASEGSTSAHKGIQCYTCKSNGHHKAQCLNHVVGLSKKQPLEEENYLQTQSMILEAEPAREDEASNLEDDKPIYVLCPLLTTREEKEEDWC